MEYREAVHSPQKNSGPSRRHRLATTTHAALDPAIEAAGDAAAQAVIDAAAAAPTAVEAVAAAEQANLAVADAAHEAVAHASPSAAAAGVQLAKQGGHKVRHELFRLSHMLEGADLRRTHLTPLGYASVVNYNYCYCYMHYLFASISSLHLPSLLPLFLGLSTSL